MFVLNLSRMMLKCEHIFACQGLRMLSTATDSANSVANNLTVLKQLGFSDDESKKLISSKVVSKLSPRELEKRLDMLQKLGFIDQNNAHKLIQHPNVLRFQHTVIDHRFKVLEESGVLREDISLGKVLRYTKLSKSSIYLLKQQGIIDDSIDVTREILSYSDLPSYLYPETDEVQTLIEVQANATKCYLTWLLDVKKEVVEKKFKTYNLNNRSIRLMKQIFDILNTSFEFPKEKIGRHFYLFQIHPENLLDMLERVPVVDVRPLKTIANLAPKILIRPTDTILEILQIFKDHNIDEKIISKYPEIFTLAPETVRNRIQIFYTDPQYKYLVNNSRLFKCISNFRGSTERTNIIRALKWRCYSADILGTNRSLFETRLKLRPDSYNGTDIVHFLHKEMDMPHKDVHHAMSQHPLWHYVPLATIATTLDFLRQSGFTHSQIVSALPIILYPKSEVEKCVEKLEQEPEADCCRDPSSGKVRPEVLLHLVLYFLERPFHFTGNGVWELDPLHTDQSQ